MTRPEDLAPHCIRNVIGKMPQLDPAEIGDVVLGCAQAHAMQGSNVARLSALLAGLSPRHRSGYDRESILLFRFQAITIPAHQILHAGVDAAIWRRCRKHHDDTSQHRSLSRGEGAETRHLHGDGDTAEVVAKRYDIRRRVQGEYSLLSQQRTARAQAEGFFEGEIARASRDCRTESRQYSAMSHVSALGPTGSVWGASTGMRVSLEM